MSLHWVHAVAVQCDYCDRRPAGLMRLCWSEAAVDARVYGWWVEEATGECACPDCLRTMQALPVPQPDEIIQLADPLPGEEVRS